MNYYDWINTKHTCKDCGWVGLGKVAEMGESFNDGSEYHCPKCNHYFGFIAYPLLNESITDSRADPADRKFAEIVLKRLKDEPKKTP